MNDNALKIMDACKKKFEANKWQCNKFAIAVAAELKVQLSGIADDIVDQIQTDSWMILKDGVEAKNKADEGWFVIGGLKAADEIPPNIHGHVVVVLSGSLAHGKYPTAMWGSLGGPLPSAGKDTVNFSWSRMNSDRIIYAAKQV